MSFDPRPEAERIWNEIGYQPPFPRDIADAIMGAFEVAIIVQSSLSICSVDAWLRERGRPRLGTQNDRALRACLLARRGHGLIFVDRGLSPDENRFAVAHEFSHFVLHYTGPRRRAVARLGRSILEVLDGQRGATPQERLSGIFAGVPVGLYQDLLVRDADDRPHQAIVDIEREADLLACELLAPAIDVGRAASPPTQALMREVFGLPDAIANQWADYVAALAPRRDPLVLSLQQHIKKNR